MALYTAGLRDLRVLHAGDVEMPPGDIVTSLGCLETAAEAIARAHAMPVVLSSDHSIAYADVKGVANVLGQG